MTEGISRFGSVGHDHPNMTHVMEARRAAQLGDFDLLRNMLDNELVHAGAMDSDDCSLLHWAAINNRIDVAKLLLQRGANVHAIGGVLSSTPLHWASRHGHSEMVALLIQNGADPEIKDGEGFMALHIAAQFGATPVVAYLVASGQSPNAFDSTHMTPLMWAAFKVQGPNPLSVLLKLGADVNLVDSNVKGTALHWAVVAGNVWGIRELLKTDICLTTTNRQNDTALDIAREKGNHVIVQMLEAASRKRKQIPSTVRQVLMEDENLNRRIICSMPTIASILLLTIPYLNTTASVKWILFALLCVVAFFVKSYHKRLVIDYFPVSIASTVIGLFLFTWFLFLNAISPWHTQIFVLFLSIVIPIVFARNIYTDPGVINSTFASKVDAVRRAVEEDRFGRDFCVTCLIRRPPRVCDKCIYRHDHHCPWISNCVGGSNHRFFMFSLVLLLMGGVVISVSSILYMRAECIEMDTLDVIACEPMVLVSAVLSTVATGLLFSLIVMQLYQIGVGLTTNERLNWKRYGFMTMKEDELTSKSPYDAGCSENLRLFFLSAQLDNVDVEPKINVLTV